MFNSLILLVGNVASGKSTFAGGYISRNAVLLSSDSFRAVIGSGEEDQTVSKQVFEILRWNTEYFLKNSIYTVIVDATNKTEKDRKPFIDIAKKWGANVTCYYFDVPLEKCIERNKLRSRIVPDDIIIKFQDKLQIPSIYEGFDEIYWVDSNGDAKAVVRKEIKFE